MYEKQLGEGDVGIAMCEKPYKYRNQVCSRADASLRARAEHWPVNEFEDRPPHLAA
jgi:hypothetical protein